MAVAGAELREHERVESLDELEAEEADQVVHRWAGIFGTVEEGPSRSRGGCQAARRAWAAAGYSGHGNVLGLACGDLVARAILGEQPPELELFDPARLLGR